MRRGMMKYRIKVYRPITERNAFGETQVTEWSEVGVWYAQRTSLSGRSLVEASELFSDYSATFIVDYSHKPEEGWQLESEGVLYRIDAVEPNLARRLKTLKCNRVNQ